MKLALLSLTHAIDPDAKVYHRNFHMFCNRKFPKIMMNYSGGTTVEDLLEAMNHT